MTISIRLRLTLWYSAAVAVLLVAVTGALLVVESRVSVARLDAELRRVNSTLATVLQNELSEGLAPPAASEDALAEVLVAGRHMAILSRDGHMLASRWSLASRPLEGGPIGADDATWTIEQPEHARLHRASRAPVPEGFIVVTAASWDEIDEEHDDLRRALGVVIPLAMLLLAAGSWWVAGAAIRPATRMASEARAITDRSPEMRLTIGRRDELGILAAAFNELLERLEAGLKERRRFLAEASHELRTPVSVARTAADVALSRPQRPEAEYREALAIVSRQMRQQGRLVSDMLALARTDASEWPLTLREFYFDELLADVERAMRLTAGEAGVGLEVRCPSDLQMRGDEDLLAQMLTNLLENAIQHTPAAGRVDVDASVYAGSVHVVVRDTGGGVGKDDRERIFDPFVRINPAAENTGMGLGLVIARRIARVHGGDVILESSAASGTAFRVTLPLT